MPAFISPFDNKEYSSFTAAVRAACLCSGVSLNAALARINLLGWSFKRAVTEQLLPAEEGLIYMLKHRKSGKGYIGKTSVNGLNELLSSYVKQAQGGKGGEGSLKEALREEGLAAFEVIILDEHSHDVLRDVRKYIEQHGTRTHGYNKTKGGARGMRAHRITYQGKTYQSPAHLIKEEAGEEGLDKIHQFYKTIKTAGGWHNLTDDLVSQALLATGSEKLLFSRLLKYVATHGHCVVDPGTLLYKQLKPLLRAKDPNIRAELWRMNFFRRCGPAAWHDALVAHTTAPAQSDAVHDSWGARVRLAFLETSKHSTHNALAERLAAYRETCNSQNLLKLSRKSRILKVIEFRRVAEKSSMLFTGADLWLQDAGFISGRPFTENDLLAARVVRTAGLSGASQLPLRTVLRILTVRRTSNRFEGDDALKRLGVRWNGRKRLYVLEPSSQMIAARQELATDAAREQSKEVELPIFYQHSSPKPTQDTLTFSAPPLAPESKEAASTLFLATDKRPQKVQGWEAYIRQITKRYPFLVKST